MTQTSYTKGFTIIELLIVMTIMSVLLALSAPFVTSTRSDIAMNRTVRQVKTDLVTNMGYSLAGKSIAALSHGNLMDASQIPSHYALYFATDSDWGGGIPYQYLEFTPEGEDDISINYQFEKEWPSSTVYLKEIRLDGSAISSAYIFFTSPFGKINFLTGHDSLLSGGSLDIDETIKNESDYEEIEFDFIYKDEELTLTTLSFNVDKTINIF